MITRTPSAVPLDQVLPVLMAALPLKKDYAEYDPVFECLRVLVEARHPVVLGSMAHVVKTITHALQNEMTASTRKNASDLVKALSVSDHAGFESVIATLAKDDHALLVSSLGLVA
jgi:hypothetical protein